MPKPMIKKQAPTKLEDILSASTKVEQKQQLSHADKLRLDAVLRQPRTKAYMESVHQLDAGGHAHNQELVKKIIETIKNEYQDIDLFDLDIFLGFVSVCGLGAPYEVHTLNFSGEIIEHYKSGQSLPCDMEKARTIAMFGGYSFVEVYTDCCRAIASDGSVSVIPFN